MDSLPESIPSVIYGWTAFFVISAFLMPLSVSKAADKAREIDTRLSGTLPTTTMTGRRLQALNVTLVFYTMCVFYLGVLFAAFVVYGILNIVHAAMDAYFRNSINNEVSAARAVKIMDRADAWLDPGTVLSFLSIRYWPAHLLVFVCTMLAAVLHSLLLGSRAAKKKRGRDRGDTTTVYDTYRRTVLTTTQSVFWALYVAVVVREMMCVASAKS